MIAPSVSIFKNAFDKEPVNVSLAAILEDIRAGKYAAQIARLRALRATDPSEYDRQKKCLPAFTLSGTFTARKADALVAHSGLLCGDLDHLGDGLPALRAKLRKDPHVAFGFVSPGGQGLKLGIPIDGTRHREGFRAAEAYFHDHYGATLDAACKDVSRLCFVSHDPDLWENPEAVPLTLSAAAEKNPDPTLHSDSGPTLHSDIVTQVVCVTVSPVSLCLCVKSLAEAVEIALPETPGQNHDYLWKLARALLTLEQQAGPFSAGQRREVFEKWHALASAKGVLRAGQSKDEYLVEFMNACRKAKIPLGSGTTELAWAAAQTEPLPPEAEVFETREAKLLVALCWQLSKGAQGKPWFLACRTAAALTGKSHTMMATWLSALVAMEILKIVEPGTKTRATSYQYCAR